MTQVSNRSSTTVFCVGCGKTQTEHFGSAQKKFKESGWESKFTGGISVHFCSDCVARNYIARFPEVNLAVPFVLELIL